MAWTKEEPKETGSYWAKHCYHGKVVVSVLVVDGVVHAAENGLYGWNRHFGSFLEWWDQPIPEPED
jgi:hypothetical protein